MMGNCHVPFLGEGKEVILIHVADRLHESSDRGRPPDPPN